MLKREAIPTLLMGLVAAAPSVAQQQAPTASRTKIVFLGTGAPGPNPDRSGPATAIVVDDTAYLVDFGPGVIRRANEAFLTKGIGGLEPTKVRVAFVTHLHSDHTVGYPDLIFTTWTIGRRMPLEVYGPHGLNSMTEHLIEAFRVDIDTRSSANGQQRDYPDGYKVNSHEITAGVIYEDSNVKVTAFATKHAMESYGYRFDTPDRSIVISGDTNPTQATIDACSGCDVLIHEGQRFVATRSEISRQFGEQYHTTIPQLAELAREAKPELLLIYHQGGATGTEQQVFDEMRARYTGLFAVARDLDIY
jgi:ribonuclease Z